MCIRDSKPPTPHTIAISTEKAKYCRELRARLRAIRAQGAYIHNLSPFWDHYRKNGKEDKLGWRLDYNMKHRGDVYATHGLGPVAQALDIHRGDRITTLVAMDTKSVVGKDLVAVSYTHLDVYQRQGV